MHKTRFGKYGHFVASHRETKQQRVGQQKQGSKAKQIAGAVGYRIDRYPNSKGGRRTRLRYVKDIG